MSLLDQEYYALCDALNFIENESIPRLRDLMVKQSDIDSLRSNYELLTDKYFYLRHLKSVLAPLDECLASIETEGLLTVSSSISGDWEHHYVAPPYLVLNRHRSLEEAPTLEYWLIVSYQLIDLGLSELESLRQEAFNRFSESRDESTDTNSDNTNVESEWEQAFEPVRTYFISTPHEIRHILKEKRGTILISEMMKYKAAFLLRPLVDLFNLRGSRGFRIKIKIHNDDPIMLTGDQGLMTNYRSAMSDGAKKLEECKELEASFMQSLKKHNLDFMDSSDA